MKCGDTIDHLKAKIQARTGIEGADIDVLARALVLDGGTTLQYDRGQVLDGGKTLEWYGLFEDSVVHVVWKPCHQG